MEDEGDFDGDGEEYGLSKGDRDVLEVDFAVAEPHAEVKTGEGKGPHEGEEECGKEEGNGECGGGVGIETQQYDHECGPAEDGETGEADEIIF